MRVLPKVLVVSGVLMMVVGMIATITMLIAQDRCQHDQPDSYVTGVAACSSYGTGADYSYLVLAGGACTILAGVLSVPLARRRRGGTTATAHRMDAPYGGRTSLQVAREARPR
jgi:hypothetical protein